MGVISSEAHPFVTDSSVCPSPHSPTSGPITFLLHTWLSCVLLSDFKASLAACSHSNWVTRKKWDKAWSGIKKGLFRLRRGRKWESGQSSLNNPLFYFSRFLEDHVTRSSFIAVKDTCIFLSVPIHAWVATLQYFHMSFASIHPPSHQYLQQLIVQPVSVGIFLLFYTCRAFVALI